MGGKPKLRYHIRIAEQVDPRWSHWFEDLALRVDGEGTLIEGQLADTTALYGLIDRLRDLGLTLVSVMPSDEWPGVSRD
jgi:hypothetical protein